MKFADRVKPRNNDRNLQNMRALCVLQLACGSENNLPAYGPHDKQLRDARCTAD
jgi:hypothetical protein